MTMLMADDFIGWFTPNELKGNGEDRLMETAYHEAGHALIHLLYGFIPKICTIIPDEDYLGHVKPAYSEYDFEPLDSYLFDNEIEMSSKEAMEFQINTKLAGIIAGSFYSGECNYEGALSDLNGIVDIHVDNEITDISTIQAYYDQTFNMLSSNDSILKKIAEDLYNKKTLDKEYFEEILKTEVFK